MREEKNQHEVQEETSPVTRDEGSIRQAPSRRWLPAAALLLACSTGFSIIGLVRERRQARRLAASNTELSSSLNQTRSQVEALTAKLDSLSSQLGAEQAEPARASRTSMPHRALAGPVKTRAAEDPRWKQVQADLAEHKKQIAEAQQDIAKTRSELEGSLNSTRDELGGAIARNHEELVALEKRGERSYYEFDLTKSKQFRRVGPISLSLRKADTKHDQYDMLMLVDDYKLTKKRVSLYEPVLLYPADTEQALALVVNRIEKNQVHGYVSEPKYKKAELAASAPTGSESSSAPGAQVNLAHRPEATR